LDFGCSVNGYQSDITRTVCCGKASDEAHKVYDIVLRAHQAARRGVRVGATCGEIDQLARQVIEDAGFGEFFVHRTGHGIGMRGHEEPYIIGGSDVALLPGDCFSIEPGIYLPLKFGIRIENIVAATTQGESSMNDEPSSTLIEVN
jgi:Xaa-Pro aminopeptidase